MADLNALLRPQSIVLVGASPDPHIIRGRLVTAMNACEFKGPVYCVSRSHDVIAGFRAFPSVDEVPEPVDLAIITIPANLVADALEACGQKGIKAAVIISSGFAEERGDAGPERQRRVAEIAARYDLAIIGPNGEGFMNSALPLTASFSPAVIDVGPHLLPDDARGGAIAAVSQSGGIGFSFFNRGRPRNLKFSYVVSMGNEAGLDSLDIANYLVDDPDTDVILMFIEGLKRPGKLARVASAAARAGKPMVVAKMGSSEAGAKAAASHTASLAGSYAAYQAMFDRYGIMAAGHAEELVDMAAAFAQYRDLLPKGKRVAILTPSGGAGIWLSDACAAKGLSVPELDADTRAAIDAHLPAYGASGNPVDLTAQAVSAVGYAKPVEIMAASPQVDAVMVACSVINPGHIEKDQHNLSALRDRLDKPVIFCGYTEANPRVFEILARAGYPCFTNMPNAARAMAALADYWQFQSRFSRGEVQFDEVMADEALRAAIGRGGPIPEHRAKAILAEHGVGNFSGAVVTSAEEAARVADEASGPVAMKVQSAEISHKTEAGAVALDIRGAGAAREAYERITVAAKAYVPEATVDGVLVEPMAGPGVEMILGVVRDPDFGPMLMVGSGGVLVELIEDVAMSPVPLGDGEANRMLDSLKGAKLLAGIRGAPAADRGALVALMVSLSRFAAAAGDALAELDLNPVIVHPVGQGVTVADALIIPRATAG